MDEKMIGQGEPKKKLITGKTITISLVLVVLVVIFVTIISIVVFTGDDEESLPTEEGENTFVPLPVPAPEDPLGQTTPAPTPTPTPDAEPPPLVEFEEDASIADDPNYGKCEHTWSDSAAPDDYSGGTLKSETKQTECSKQITQEECEAVDVYHELGDTFLTGDGISDCTWN